MPLLWHRGLKAPFPSPQRLPQSHGRVLSHPPSCSLMRLLFCLELGVFLLQYLNKIICLDCLGGLLWTPKPEGFFPESPDLGGFSTY